MSSSQRFMGSIMKPRAGRIDKFTSRTAINTNNYVKSG